MSAIVPKTFLNPLPIFEKNDLSPMSECSTERGVGQNLHLRKTFCCLELFVAPRTTVVGFVLGHLKLSFAAGALKGHGALFTSQAGLRRAAKLANARRDQ